MIERFCSPFRIWLILIVLTGLSLFVAEQLSARIVSLAGIFVIAAIKAEMVMDHYMEFRQAEQQWPIMYSIWIVAVTGMLILGHIGPVSL